ncbi:MAG: WXG100 family type VII secretion target [Anaerolineae bacterium]|nr:WXG100 family type VII secretion target [Anaerolineae bacterium]
MPLSLRSDYDYLQRVAKQLNDHADEVRTAMLRIQQHVHSLEDGGWLGQAADRFYDEMQAATFPFLKQLDGDLGQTGTDTARLIALFQQTDEHSRRYFAAGAGGGGISDPQALARASKVEALTIKQKVSEVGASPQFGLTADLDAGQSAAGYFPGNTKYTNIKVSRASTSAGASGDPHEDQLAKHSVQPDGTIKPGNAGNLMEEEGIYYFMQNGADPAVEGVEQQAAKLPRPITVDDVTMKRGVTDADAQMQEGGVTGFTRKVIGVTKALPEVDDEVLVNFAHGDSTSTADPKIADG